MTFARATAFSALWFCLACNGTASEMGGDSGIAPTVDSGTATHDAGLQVETVDSGTITADAGNAFDAGNSFDAGTQPIDAGTPTLVLVGYGQRRVMSLDGLTWDHFQQVTPNGGDDNDLFRGVTYGGGVFLAVGGSSHGLSMTSVDGITWENLNIAASAWIGQAAWLNGQFVASGGNGLRMRSTDHGKTWSDEAGYQGIHYRDLVAGNGIAVTVGHTYGGVGAIATTTDGLIWTTRVDSGDTFNSVAFGNGVFVAVGGGGRLASSSDGITWHDHDLKATQGGSALFTGTEFLVGLGNTTYRSTDGTTWSATGATRDVNFYAFDRAFTLGWPATIDSSTDLKAWTNVFNPQGSGFTRFALGRVP